MRSSGGALAELACWPHIGCSLHAEVHARPVSQPEAAISAAAWLCCQGNAHLICKVALRAAGPSVLQVQRLAAAAGAIKVAMLAVSGAFHTSLMQPARDALVQARLAPLHIVSATHYGPLSYLGVCALPC